MINVCKFVLGKLNTNCYIVYDDISKDAIIIDCAEYVDLYNYITSNDLNLKAILLTHGHFDHIGGCAYFKNIGIPIYIYKFDFEKCLDNNLNLSTTFGMAINTFKPDNIFIGEETKTSFGSININIIHTPGHSEGSCVYIVGKYVFSGDTIFDVGYGRTDFYDGSMIKLRNSIRKLSKYINSNYILMPGH